MSSKHALIMLKRNPPPPSHQRKKKQAYHLLRARRPLICFEVYKGKLFWLQTDKEMWNFILHSIKENSFQGGLCNHFLLPIIYLYLHLKSKYFFYCQYWFLTPTKCPWSFSKLYLMSDIMFMDELWITRHSKSNQIPWENGTSCKIIVSIINNVHCPFSIRKVQNAIFTFWMRQTLKCMKISLA